MILKVTHRLQAISARMANVPRYCCRSRTKYWKCSCSQILLCIAAGNVCIFSFWPYEAFITIGYSFFVWYERYAMLFHRPYVIIIGNHDAFDAPYVRSNSDFNYFHNNARTAVLSHDKQRTHSGFSYSFTHQTVFGDYKYVSITVYYLVCLDFCMLMHVHDLVFIVHWISSVRLHKKD